MANLFSILAYQVNDSDVQLANVFGVGIPSQGILVRGMNATAPTPLSTGIYCYSNITILATGQTYSTTQTAAQIVTLANA